MQVKTSLGIWAFGSMATRFVPGGYQPRVDRRDDRAEGRSRGRGSRRPDRRLRVPLSERACSGQSGRGAGGARRARHLLPGERPPPRLALRPGRPQLTGRRRPGRRRSAGRSTRSTSQASSARTSSSGPGSRGTTTRSRRRTGELGAVPRRDRPGRAAGKERGVTIFLEHKNSEPAMKILMRNVGMTLHVIHTLRRQGLDNVRAGHGACRAADVAGPIFYQQERIGRGFSPFRMIKFRTMVTDAAQRGGQITAGRDARVTPVGRILRRLKIDELPQIHQRAARRYEPGGTATGSAALRRTVPRRLPLPIDRAAGDHGPGIIEFRDEQAVLGQAADPEQEYIQRVLPLKIALSREYLDACRCGTI